MAYEPSFSKTKKSKSKGLNLSASEADMLPIMNLMVVLIPVLLSAAEMIKIRVLDVNLPAAPAIEDQINKQTSNIPVDQDSRRLDLNVIVTKEGFVVSALGRRLKLMNELKDTITELNKKEYDLTDTTGLSPEIESKFENGFDKETFSSLNSLLVKLKSTIYNNKISILDSNVVTLSADKDIDYQTIISTIDAMREKNDNGIKKDLFSIINFGG
ncbi:MAG: biopolymer transporter ExbD [Candidatus Delongbacteria bacterium]|nr:biopolymer transporter ExbD [Candidatus Delongbacteria bacterium]MBN2836611.1 biopolymer transporter ExbD [Candidatus Delongbacteria bacterium]